LIAENREDMVEENEMDNYLECVMAVHKLMQSERQLMTGIIPLTHRHRIFEIIAVDAMDSIVQEGEVSHKLVLPDVVYLQAHCLRLEHIRT